MSNKVVSRCCSTLRFPPNGDAVDKQTIMSQPFPSTTSSSSWECIACTYMNDNGHGLACVMCSTERNRSNKRSEKRRRRTATTMPVLLSSTVDKSVGASPSSSLEVSHELCASKRCKVEGPLPSNNGVTSSGDLDFFNNAVGVSNDSERQRCICCCTSFS